MDSGGQEISCNPIKNFQRNVSVLCDIVVVDQVRCYGSIHQFVTNNVVRRQSNRQCIVYFVCTLATLSLKMTEEKFVKGTLP